MLLDELLDEARAKMRAYISAESESEAESLFDALVRYHLPAIGAKCPAYGAALTGALDWLMTRRSEQRLALS